MFHELLKEKFEYLTNYFECALENTNRRMPQSIIFYGMDTLSQYIFAQSLARILNCKETAQPDCCCVNCNWIKENKHPAVMTISKADNKPSDDDTKTVISIAQSRMIKNSIVNTSDYHRVFIFCDVEQNDLSEFQKESLKMVEETDFKMPECQEGKVWYPLPLNQSILQDEAANALLKSIEEPPPGVTFIFLTRDREDMISTIVSRSQCFYVPAFTREYYNLDFVNNLFRDYTHFDVSDAIQKANEIYGFISENGISAEFVLCSIQNYLQNLAKSNPENKILLNKIKTDIFNIKEAQNQLRASVKELNVFESLLFKMI